MRDFRSGDLDDNAMVQAMLEEEDSSARLEVSRPWTVTDRDGLGRTLSKEALDDLAWLMAAWVDTRLIRTMNDTGLGPQNVRVTLDVQVSS